MTDAIGWRPAQQEAWCGLPICRILKLLGAIVCQVPVFFQAPALAQPKALPSPLHLEQAIAFALENNPDLEAAQARIDQAAAAIREARSAFFPHLQARLHYLRSNHPMVSDALLVSQRRLDMTGDINHPGSIGEYRPEMLLSWSLFEGGRRLMESKAARLAKEATALDKTAADNDMAASVTTAFYALAEAPKALAVAHQATATVARELELAQSRLDHGTALRSEVLSLQARLEEARQDEISAANAVALANTSLATLLAVDTQTDLVLAQEDVKPLPVPPALPELLIQAYSHRPELLAASKNQERWEKTVSAAKGALWPQLDAFALYGRDSNELGLSNHKDNYMVGMNAKMDIFTGFATSAKIQKARAQLAEAQAKARAVRLKTKKEVREAYLNLTETLARRKAAAAQERAASAALDLVQKEYRAGVAPITRFLEAQTQSQAAQLRLLATGYDVQVTQAELHRAAGLGTP